MNMSHRYGIYQSTSKSCIFYKQDEDGNQSTFNIFVTPSKGEKTVFAFIDNEQMRDESWTTAKGADIREIIKAFNRWADDAPFVFELEAEKSMGECLSTVLKKEQK